jgi:hypothetical protein
MSNTMLPPELIERLSQIPFRERREAMKSLRSELGLSCAAATMASLDYLRVKDFEDGVQVLDAESMSRLAYALVHEYAVLIVPATANRFCLTEVIRLYQAEETRRPEEVDSLLARIRALMRKRHEIPTPTLAMSSLRICASRRHSPVFADPRTR